MILLACSIPFVAGARYLRAFVENVKASGLMARIIEQNGVRGVSVAPPVREAEGS